MSHPAVSPARTESLCQHGSGRVERCAAGGLLPGNGGPGANDRAWNARAADVGSGTRADQALEHGQSGSGFRASADAVPAPKPAESGGTRTWLTLSSLLAAITHHRNRIFPRVLRQIDAEFQIGPTDALRTRQSEASSSGCASSCAPLAGSSHSQGISSGPASFRTCT